MLEEEQDLSDPTAPTLVDLAINQAVLLHPKLFFLEKSKNEVFIYEDNQIKSNKSNARKLPTILVNSFHREVIE